MWRIEQLHQSLSDVYAVLSECEEINSSRLR
jgi:hypothetical protein